MIAFIETIVGDPVTWFVTVVLAGAALVFRRALSRGVDERFDKRLAEYEQQLQLTTEAARYDYRRDLAVFNLYAADRHKSVASIWAKLRIADGAVGGLFGLRRQPTFEELNAADIDAFLQAREVPEGQRLRILEHWDEDRERAMQILTPYLRMLEVREAEAKFREARNEVFLNELYLSDELIEALDDFFTMLWDWLFVAQYPEGGARREHTAEDIRTSRDALRNLLRTEVQPRGTALTDAP